MITKNSLKQVNFKSKIPHGGRGRLKLTHKNKLDQFFSWENSYGGIIGGKCVPDIYILVIDLHSVG